MDNRHRRKTKGKARIIIAILMNTIIIAIIAVTSVFVYRSMLEVEEKRCWDILEDSVETIEKETSMQINSNVNILKLVSGAMVREERTSGSQENLAAISSHLNDFQSMTIFDRIDVLMENGNLLLQTGEVRSTPIDFQALADKGISISGRRTDPETGKEVIRCAVPVIKEQKTVAILMGVVICEELPKTLSSTIYNGEAHVCLVDRTTGDFIMDDWHDKLGNIYEMKNRKMRPGYEHIDLREEISKGSTGTIAYESNVNGKESYMYFRPLPNTNWQIIVVAQEDAVFSSLKTLQRLLGYMAAIIVFVLTGYLAWSLWSLRNALKKAEDSEKHGYTDSLTGLYNQNKFSQDLDEYEQAELNDIGLLFLDLNGLKYTNDHFGHAAGDRLLKDTAQILSDVFGASVYRIGGDEFVALTHNLQKEAFKTLSSDVKRRMDEKKIEAAMGVTWHASSRFVKAQLREADDLMYIDKHNYHESNKLS